MALELRSYSSFSSRQRSLCNMADALNINPDEKVLLKLRKHWITLLGDAIGSFLLVLAPFLLFAIFIVVPPVFPSLVEFAVFVSVLWILIIWIALTIIWTNYYLDIWIVTDKRIISVDQVGLFNRKVTTLGFSQIQEITVKTEGVLEAFLHYGTIEIETAGPHSDDAKMKGIPYPERVRSVILENVTSYAGLAAANQEKDELLRTVSHEVKNYLAKDVAALASIAEGDFDKQPAMLKSVAHGALSETRKGVRSMMDMLIGKQKITTTSEPYDVTALVQSIVTDYAFALKKKGLTLSVEAPHSFFARGDGERIGRLVIRNLLDNALHYTPGGSITIAISREGGIVRLSVTDTGVGISPADMDRLFTPGGKGTHSSELNPTSTGYGLATAKEAVEEQGGHIWAESDGVGTGSTFIVELPAV